VLELLDGQPGERVLECGVGTGEYLALSVSRAGARVHGIDISRELLEECYHNFLREGLPSRVALGDIERIPFQTGAFDRVYCISTTWYLPDLEESLREMARVTRQGGTIVFDIMNWLHITPLAAHLAGRFLQRFLGRRSDPARIRSHLEVSRILTRLGLDYEVRGYYVLLPTRLPNLCQYSARFSYGLSRSPLRYLGSKLCYVCKVNKGPLKPSQNRLAALADPCCGLETKHESATCRDC